MQIINAKIYTMCDDLIIENGYIKYNNGLISGVGDMNECVKNQDDIDAKGGWLFPGFIDAHSHLGMWEDSIDFEGDDGNEQTNPSMPHLRAIDAVNPMDKCFSEARNAGITTVITGPGSANPIGGILIAMKTCGRRVDDMLVRDPVGIKFALGENPKRAYNEKGQTPMTRMGTASIIREQLYKAREYKSILDEHLSANDIEPPEYDLKCEALLPLLRRDIKAHFHAHRADDIFTAIRIAKEFSLDYVIVHATDSESVVDILAKEGVEVLCGPILCDRSKPELKALTPKTPAALQRNGVKMALITDHPVIPIQYLPLCAGLSVRDGMSYFEALKAITINAAEICGIDSVVGSLEEGKDADMVLFSGDPLSVYAKPEMVICDGEMVSEGNNSGC